VRESVARQRMIRELRDLDAVSIESTVGPGVPDVNYVDGWIEVKCIEAGRWKRAQGSDKPVRLNHPLSPEQIAWIKRRGKRGGRVFVAVRAGTDWLFFHWSDSDLPGTVPADTLRARAIWVGSDLKDKTLRKVLHDEPGP
jgi:hypothetical protein